MGPALSSPALAGHLSPDWFTGAGCTQNSLLLYAESLLPYAVGSPAPHANLPLLAPRLGQGMDWTGSVPTEQECMGARNTGVAWAQQP